MKKIFSIFAAMLLASSMMAAVINIDNTTPDALRTALNSAADGDEIVMAAGTYVESNGDFIAFDGKAVTVKAAEGAEVIIQPQVPITVSNGGHAIFENVKIDASRLTELADWYEHLLYVNDANPNGFTFRGCELYGFNLNKSMFYCNSTNKLAMAKFENCYFHDIMKSIIFVENTEGKPMVSVKNCTFENISTNTESYWAGVIDVRATDATLTVDHCTFYNVIPMNTDYSCVSKITLAKGNVSNCIFMLPTAQDGIRAMRGVTATNCITYNYLKDSGTGIHSSVTQVNCIQADPLFVDAANGNFTLGEGSPALTMNDGEPIGDPRWIPSAEPELENGYYLVGTMNNWQVEAEYKLVLNEQAEETEYMYDITFAEEDRFKVVDYQNGNWTWHPGEGEGYEIDADHVGEATVYFRPNGKQGDESWYYTIIYVAMKEEPQPAAQWAEIKFEEAIDADDIAENASFTVEDSEFAITITDPENKMAIDLNNCRFGTAENYTMYHGRLKSGGKSTSTKNFMTANIPAAGKLRIAVRTGKNADTDRNLVIKQGESELYNQAIVETMAIEVQEGDNTVNVYPFVEVEVAAGSVLLSYPTNGLNFYAFAFKAGGSTTDITNTEVSEKAVKVFQNGQLIIIKNGVKYNVLGMTL